MSKKLSSIFVIGFTILYVSISFYTKWPEVIESGKVKAENILNSINNAKTSLIGRLVNNTKIEYEDVKQNSPLTLEEKDNLKYKLTEAEQERVLIAAKRLSPMDQLRINAYLENSSKYDVTTAVNLLKDRLSDKEFERLEEIYLKLN